MRDASKQRVIHWVKVGSPLTLVLASCATDRVHRRAGPLTLRHSPPTEEPAEEWIATSVAVIPERVLSQTGSVLEHQATHAITGLAPLEYLILAVGAALVCWLVSVLWSARRRRQHRTSIDT